MNFIIPGETDNRMKEGIEPAQNAPEHAGGELPDEENLNQEQDLDQSHTEGRTPEQGEGNLPEIQGNMWSSVQFPYLRELMIFLAVDILVKNYEMIIGLLTKDLTR